jgi:chromosome partition protein MukE
MSSTSYERLEDVILDEAFPEVDLCLRRGRHIDRDDPSLYTLLVDAQGLLETFYRRFGCELVHKTDGYFYLLPTSDRLGRRHLSQVEMLVGQALTLLYLDPHTVESGGVVTREQLLAQLAGVLGADSLVKTLNPKRRKHDERVAEETVRVKVGEAVRRLATLGFVDALDESSLRLRPSLMRFAEPVRTAAAPDKALTELMASGELVFAEQTSDDEGARDDDEGDDSGESSGDEAEADEPEAEPASVFTDEWDDVGEPSPLASARDEEGEGLADCPNPEDFPELADTESAEPEAAPEPEESSREDS